MLVSKRRTAHSERTLNYALQANPARLKPDSGTATVILFPTPSAHQRPQEPRSERPYEGPELDKALALGWDIVNLRVKKIASLGLPEDNHRGHLQADTGGEGSLRESSSEC